MKIYDISTLIEPDMVVYKNKDSKRPIFTNKSNHNIADYHETAVSLDIHCGTHIDMPLHMIENGKTLDKLDIARLITQCKVMDMTHLDNPIITAEDIKDLEIMENDFIIFKTQNSYNDKINGFNYDFVYIDKSAAKFLKDKRINGVGIDALGIERDQKDHSTHKILLNEDIIIMEGLQLKGIEQGAYQLIALPIKLSCTEGSWVRAVLIDQA